MRVYIQWAVATPKGWESFDVTNLRGIRSLSKKPLPVGGETLDEKPGWINAINIQGIVFSGGDHIGIDMVGSGQNTGIKISVWNDDPVDFGTSRDAAVWTFYDPAPDARIGNAINTRQSVVRYGTPDVQAYYASFGIECRPWAEFVPPPENLTFHGIWVGDALYQQLVAAQTPHGWREWIL